MGIEVKLGKRGFWEGRRRTGVWRWFWKWCVKPRVLSILMIEDLMAGLCEVISL